MPRFFKNIGGYSAPLLDQPQQNVFRADIFMVEPLGFLVRQLHHFSGAVGQSLVHRFFLFVIVHGGRLARYIRADCGFPLRSRRGRAPAAAARRPPRDRPTPGPTGDARWPVRAAGGENRAGRRRLGSNPRPRERKGIRRESPPCGEFGGRFPPLPWEGFAEGGTSSAISGTLPGCRRRAGSMTAARHSDSDSNPTNSDSGSNSSRPVRLHQSEAKAIARSVAAVKLNRIVPSVANRQRVRNPSRSRRRFVVALIRPVLEVTIPWPRRSLVMCRMPWCFYLWPGLPQMWLYGSWSGLAVALGAAAMLDVLLLVSFGWTELIGRVCVIYCGRSSSWRGSRRFFGREGNVAVKQPSAALSLRKIPSARRWITT